MSEKFDRKLIRDAQTIQELAMGIQDRVDYNTTQSQLSEQIYELANKLEESMTGKASS